MTYSRGRYVHKLQSAVCNNKEHVRVFYYSIRSSGFPDYKSHKVQDLKICVKYDRKIHDATQGSIICTTVIQNAFFIVMNGPKLSFWEAARHREMFFTLVMEITDSNSVHVDLLMCVVEAEGDRYCLFDSRMQNENMESVEPCVYF